MAEWLAEEWLVEEWLVEEWLMEEWLMEEWLEWLVEEWLVAGGGVAGGGVAGGGVAGGGVAGVVSVLVNVLATGCVSVMGLLRRAAILTQKLHTIIKCAISPDRLVGLVVKASASRAEDPGFESHLRRDFFGVESYQ